MNDLTLRVTPDGLMVVLQTAECEEVLVPYRVYATACYAVVYWLYRRTVRTEVANE